MTSKEEIKGGCSRIRNDCERLLGEIQPAASDWPGSISRETLLFQQTIALVAALSIMVERLAMQDETPPS